jgi:hypothetical protein
VFERLKFCNSNFTIERKDALLFVLFSWRGGMGVDSVTILVFVYIKVSIF